MAISNNDVLRITAKLLKEGLHSVVNVWTARVLDTAAQTQDDIKEAVARWINSLYSTWSGELAPDITADQIEIFNETQNIAEGIEPFPVFTGGGGGGDPMPNGCAIFMFARTNIIKARGKKWMPASTEAHHADGIWGATLLTSLATTANNWISTYTDGINGVQLTPGIQVNQTDPLLITFTPFTNVVIRTEVAYQRRRKRGVGA